MSFTSGGQILVQVVGSSRALQKETSEDQAKDLLILADSEIS